ncbi:MAG: helix-turn-helix domain-containing protein [Treponema sp.]|nr:helix-turn-helix domain-containing protein [Treponema sp.]
MYKVFLVEDEIVVREGIRNSIPWEKTPYTLAGEAPDGEIALPMIRDIKPDILVTDIRMPFMDGLALSRIVKNELPWIKVIILSGHDEFEYAREAILVGVEEYLLKPVSAQDMIKTLDRIAKRIDAEKGNLLNIENLKAQIRSSADTLLKIANSGGGFPAEEDGGLPSEGFDPSRLLDIDGDMFFTRLKYASKKDLDSLIRKYTKSAGNDFAGNHMMVYFILGEIIVAASKIVEALNGDIKDIAPFSLDQKTLLEITRSKDIFSEKIRSLLEAVIEYRDAHTGGRYQSVIVKAREYIDRNFAAEDISLHSMAAHVGVSPNHLSAVFAQETGENFIEYLTRVRIERAKRLLSTTAMKSTDIAFETGFSDPHYFSFIFKKNTGLSPREYRNGKK